MRRLLLLGFFVILTLVFAINCFATGDATTYKMTIQSVQLKSSTTGNWVTIATPNQEVDIVNDASGQNTVAAAIASGIEIPIGSYDNFKLVISETMYVAGSDGAHHTSAGSSVTMEGANANTASTALWGNLVGGITGAGNVNLTETGESHKAAGTPAEVTFTLDLDAGDADNYIEVYRNGDLGTPLTMTASSVVSMWFDFDTQGTIEYVAAGPNDIMVFFPPQSGTAINVTVDGVTTTITEAQMRIDF